MLDYLSWLSARPKAFRLAISRGVGGVTADQRTVLESVSERGRTTPESVAQQVYRSFAGLALSEGTDRGQLERAFCALGGALLSKVSTSDGRVLYESPGGNTQKDLAIRLLDWVSGSPDVQALADAWLAGSPSSVSADVLEAAVAALRSYDSEVAQHLADEIQLESGALVFGGVYTQEALGQLPRDMLEEAFIQSQRTVRRLQAQLREKDASLIRERQGHRRAQVVRRVEEAIVQHESLYEVRSDLLACKTVDEVERRVQNYLRVARRS